MSECPASDQAREVHGLVRALRDEMMPAELLEEGTFVPTPDDSFNLYALNALGVFFASDKELATDMDGDLEYAACFDCNICRGPIEIDTSFGSPVLIVQRPLQCFDRTKN